MCSHNNSNSDSNDSEPTPTDEELFALDIVDGEDPSESNDLDGRYRSNPPGPGPTVGTRFVKLQDGSFAIIDKAALGGWISAAKTINLEDAR